MSDREDFTIKEWEALRQEILTLLSRGDAYLGMVWAGIAVLLGVATVERIPEVSAVAYLLVTQGWIEELRRQEGFSKLGAYIEKVLEPRLPGVSWESIKDKAHIRLRHTSSGAWTSLVLTSMYRYRLVALGTLAVWPVIAVLRLQRPEPWRIVINVLLWILCAGVYVFCVRTQTKVAARRAKWADTFADIASGGG